MLSELTHFKDRVDAGRQLADALMAYAHRDDVIVLGLARGGVPVAYEVAERLHAPLDIVVVRKLGVPGWDELAMGAIASGGVRVLNEDMIRHASITPKQVASSTLREMEEILRREIHYRGHAGLPFVKGKTVILIDDGLATGATMQCAIRALQPEKPAAIIVAAPAASPEACQILRPMVNELVTLMVPDGFRAVSEWYEDFRQTADDEVTHLMMLARRGNGSN